MTDKLKEELRQFTATEQWYRNPLFSKFLYTEGVKYLAEQAGAYWLIDHIFSNQYDLYFAIEPFQTWTIKTKDKQALITVDDGNGKFIKEYNIEYTDFPPQELKLWFTNKTLLLPSEY